ncbi:MAG: TIM-barrel signal transduction protein, partial [uncultured Acetobacteraceae bacterium]
APLPAPGSAGEVPRHDRPPPAHRGRRRGHRPVRQVRGGRRHRPHRHLQFRPLPHGGPRLPRRPARLRQRERDRQGDGARGAAGRPAHPRAGRRERHRPLRHHGRAAGRAEGARLRRRAELPDRRPDRRRVPRQPRRNRHVLRARSGHDPRGAREGHADHPLRLQRRRGGRDGEGRRRHGRVPHGPDHRRRDRRRDGAHAGRLRARHGRMGRGRAPRPGRRDRALPRRADLQPGGRRLRAEERAPLPRLLRRLLHGAPARRDGAHRADAPLQVADLL